MTALPQSDERRCLLCGCVLARDARHEAQLCSNCLSSRLCYDPATDAGFDSDLEALFLTHPATVVNPLHMLGVASRYRVAVKSAVRRLRRQLVIVGVPLGGYVCLGTKSAPPDRRRRRHA